MKIRQCESVALHTGASKCPPDFQNMRGAILVRPGQKLPKDLTAEKLEKLVHAERSERVYGIVRFAEYSKNGGEVQTAANGYDGEAPTGISARKDTFTLNRYNPALDASLTGCYNQPWDVYFFDGDNILYGIDDGTDMMAGYPMNSVYSDSVPFRTSSALPTQSITFVHSDARLAKMKFQFERLEFNINSNALVLGLLPVKLKKLDSPANAYKVIEATGNLDVTDIYGPLIADAGAAVLNGTTTAATYTEGVKLLSISVTGSAEVTLKSPSVLFENDIKGIEGI